MIKQLLNDKSLLEKFKDRDELNECVKKLMQEQVKLKNENNKVIHFSDLRGA
ncbi:MULTISPECIES: hypothetical protein [Staphylococcus]|jgi:hypothetical protein|uniref:Uncharacterized protein n=2 Tax=root TaxID=1 RepID=A0A8F7J5E0_STAEP|nr:MULTISPECIES: hypothetical protein [Staphylococcus]MDU7271535.1 hypothetical protein [Staphylococcus lugdunensis]QPB07577.1 hypothetical protein PLKLOBMN_00006 [Staphylococcus phage PhiSepi-HH1]DAJ17251.1 MAG TPA: hypothetical protein [Siphoviridae sp. ctza41]EFV89608.1 hypothetical protein GSEF_0251 [Staphylococcus epidermidis FRI909]EHQ73547.1 hypothetical protein SEVCU041_1039 [Staphylococcus epidermidis VCU041]